MRFTIYEFFFNAQRANRLSQFESFSDFRFDAARAREAPAAQGFKQHKDSNADENEPQPPDVEKRHAAHDEEQSRDAAACTPSA